MSDFTTFIRKKLEELSISQRSLASASGISRSTIKRALSGTTRVELGTIQVLLRTLGYSLTMVQCSEPSTCLKKASPAKQIESSVVLAPKRRAVKKRLIRAVGMRRMN